MRSITTGAGLAILGACVITASAIFSSHSGLAMAQTGSERRIMKIENSNNEKGGTFGFQYRFWSDGVIERRCTGIIGFNGESWLSRSYPATLWEVVDDGQIH